MKRVLSLIVMVLVLENAAATAPFFLIELGEHQHIRWMQGVMSSVVNAVVAEEVHDALVAIDSPKAVVPVSILGFEKKQRLVLSIVYLTDEARDVAGIASIAEKRIVKASIAAGEVQINGDGGMFGLDEDDLVTKIVDHSGILNSLRKEILATIDPVLVDKTFPFVPDVSLGRVRSQALVDFVSKFAGISPHQNEIKIMMDRINTRLNEVVAVLPVHSKFTTAIAVKSVDLYGFDRKSVKKITLR